MKKLLFIIITSLTPIVLAQQSSIVTYKIIKAKEKPDLEDIKNRMGTDYFENTLRKEAKIFQIAKDFDFVLQFNANESLYQWQEEMPDETTSPYLMILAKLKGGGMSVKYQNKKDSLLMVQGMSPASKQWYRETGSLYKNNWKITQETDTYLGYPVIKATSGHDIVWFTPQIPVPFGPNGLGGLPGLILKYKHNAKLRGLYELVAVKIKFFKKPVKIKKPSKGTLRTEEEGKKIRIQEMKIIME